MSESYWPWELMGESSYQEIWIEKKIWIGNIKGIDHIDLIILYCTVMDILTYYKFEH